MTPPRFTIVLPTHNGGAYLRGCVASVLAQTWPHFDLAVLENASDDGSRQWLEGLADPRVRLHPSDRLLPIQDNWARALALPKSEFMTLLGDDDALDPDYLQTVAALIDRHPDATLYHARFRFIGPDGEILRHCRPLPERETAAEYLAALFRGERDTYGTGYVMRSADYEAAGGIPAFERLLFADDALWLTLMRRGGKAAAPRECFSCRSHPASTSAAGGSSWRAWAKAMPQYGAFLEGLAEQDPGIKKAVTEHGLGYLTNYGRTKYREALVQAAQNDARPEPGLLTAMCAGFDRLLPQLAAEIRGPREIRAREFIARHSLTRRLYNAFIRARHGTRHE